MLVLNEWMGRAGKVTEKLQMPGIVLGGFHNVSLDLSSFRAYKNEAK